MNLNINVPNFIRKRLDLAYVWHPVLANRFDLFPSYHETFYKLGHYPFKVNKRGQFRGNFAAPSKCTFLKHTDCMHHGPHFDSVEKSRMIQKMVHT